jgi:hypothetical protein
MTAPTTTLHQVLIGDGMPKSDQSIRKSADSSTSAYLPSNLQTHPPIHLHPWSPTFASGLQSKAKWTQKLRRH